MIREEKIVTYVCDICKRESNEEMPTITAPLFFLTEETEGYPLKKPSLRSKSFELCPVCIEAVVNIKGWGAQGYNTYQIREKKPKD